MKILQFILVIGITTLFASCASQSPLTGGERDASPPKLVLSVPQNGAVNSYPKQLDFEFDEFVQVKSLNQKLIVSPPLKYQPELKQKAKGFSLILKDTLKPNTTYNFYFGDAIQDLNENNPLSDFNFVFSTGSEIDSLSVKGAISDALTLKPEKDFLVALYKDTTDSTPLKNKPDYITRSNASGIFQFNYVKAGRYKMVGFIDKNNNYLLNPENEKIAFLKNPITISQESKNDSLLLFSFSEDRTKQYIKKSSRKLPYKAEIIFNTSSDFKPTLYNDSLKILDYYSTVKNDTLTVFFKDSLQYFNENIKLIIGYYKTDSLRNSKMTKDTIVLNWSERDKYKPSVSVNYQWSIKNQSRINAKQPLSILFNEPIDLKPHAIVLFDSAKKNIPIELYKDSSNCLKWHIKAKLADGKNYRLFLDTTYIKSSYGHSLKNDTLSFETMLPEDFANLKINIKLPNHTTFIIELQDEKSNLVKKWQVSSDANLHVERLMPGKYNLKATEDSNNNGKWDNGFYILHLQPEKTFYYNQTFQLRANWDLEVNWSVK